MKNIAIALALVAAVAGCSSSAPSKSDAAVIRVRPIEVPRARPLPNAQFTTIVHVDVGNTSGSEIELQRIEISSIGEGPYEIGSASRDFNQTIAPNVARTFSIWAPARYRDLDETLAQSAGVVMVRGVAVFRSPAGDFRKSFVQRTGTTMNQER